MLKEVITFVFVIVFFLVVGIVVSVSDFDFKLAEFAVGNSVDSKKAGIEIYSIYSKKSYSSKKSDNSSVMKAITVKVIINDGERLVNVDYGTSQLEVMAVFGKRFENILTISNYFKIINNGDVIDVR